MRRAITILMVLPPAAVFGQTVAGPTFEVAAIKPSSGDPSSSGISTGHGRLDGHNVTLKRCVMGAYGVGPNQVLGGPDWFSTDRFEITAKAEQPDGDHILMTMLQTLLAERFKLALHRESKPISAYVLEAGKNAAARLEKGGGTGATTNNGNGNIVATNATMDHFAEVLSRQMDLPVVNHTGLDGVFNLKLQWSPDSARPANPAAGAVIEGPSIFTAIQELGLRLHAEKVPVEVLVVDHAERPSEN